jgi:anti-sigma regulatory factor (Ser/Thr protein kinase)
VRVPLRRRWISTARFEAAIGDSDLSRHLEAGGTVCFDFDEGSALPIGVGMRLLSFLNQLARNRAGRVHLQFSSRENLFGYLDRNGFFDLLDRRISSDPARPAFSSAVLHRGRASSLVEIVRLDPRLSGEARTDTVTPLVDALMRLYGDGPRAKHLHNSAYATLTELIDNVYSHSETPIAGFAVLQAYRQRRAVQIAVSDSGVGIPESIRRGLGARVLRRSDEELIVDAFRKGLSRHGSRQGRSCGLPLCAQLAAEFGSTVYVRTPSADVTLEPHTGGPGQHEARITRPTAKLAGTHICLDFPLDG